MFARETRRVGIAHHTVIGVLLAFVNGLIAAIECTLNRPPITVASRLMAHMTWPAVLTGLRMSGTSCSRSEMQITARRNKSDTRRNGAH